MSGHSRKGSASSGSGSRHPPTPSPSPPYESFIYLLHSDSGRPLFFEFLRAGFSEQHLLFWEQVQSYKHIHNLAAAGKDTSASSPPLPTPYKKAVNINTKFILAGAPAQINITEQTRNRIHHTLQKHAANASPPPLSLFDESETVCLELMKGNYYYSFKETQDYEEWSAQEKKKLHAHERDKEKSKKGKTSKKCVIL